MEENRIAEMYQEAEELMEEGKWDEGMEMIEEILEEDPDYPPALNKMGVFHAQREELDKAEEYFSAALAGDPDYVPALTNSGNIHQHRGELEEAIELYERAIELDPDYGPAHNNLGAAYKKMGDVKKAVSHLKTARKKGSYAVDTDQPLLKNPGCLIILILIGISAVAIAVKYFS